MKQETQEQQVSMKVNQANLVKGLKYSFTNKTTVLGELSRVNYLVPLTTIRMAG